MTKDCELARYDVCNESYFDTEKVLNFISSHFDKDFEEVLDYYKEKFNYKEQMKTNLTLDKVPENL